MAGRVKVVVTVAARPETASQIEAIVRELCRESRKEPGCLSYEVLRNNADKNGFVLYEEWDSDAHLDAHNKTPHFGKAVSAAVPLLAQPLEVGRYTTIM